MTAEFDSRTYAAYVMADRPRHTCQLIFSDKPTLAEAKKDVFAQFAKFYPEFADPYIHDVMPMKEYEGRVETAENLNRDLNG